jgi:nucleoside-diphosphate-sugar epimerase
VHAASGASPALYNKDPVGVLLPNSVGTALLCEQAVKWNSRCLLFFSTGEVYGINSKEMLSEKDYGYIDLSDVRNCYAESKRMGETTCLSYAHQHGLNTVSARFHTYGPQMELYDGRVFADFIRNAVRREPISMTSNGLAKRCFCYLADATLGFLHLIAHGERGKSYNLANPDAEISIVNLAHLVASLVQPKLAVREVELASTRADYIPSPVARSLPNITGLQSLGWSPSVDLATGFERTLLSYQV